MSRTRRDRTNNTRLLMLHVSCLVELKHRHNLFYLAHKLVDDYPKLPISWFAVGSYYLLVDEYNDARRYFAKAGSMDPQFGDAWVGYAAAFAKEGEHEQAISAYVSAQKLMKGRHEPKMYAGMLHLQQESLDQAKHYLEEARAICPNDPSLENELGCYWYKIKEYGKANKFFLNALRLGNGMVGFLIR